MKVTLDLSEYMLPKFYQTHFQTQLSRSQFLVLEIILNLLGSEKQVRLEVSVQGVQIRRNTPPQIK
jgi:hypothetical protein